MFPEHWDLEQVTRHALAEILVNQHKILEREEKLMDALQTLQAAITKLAADVAAFITANSGGANDAQLAALTAQIQAIDVTVAPAAPAAAAK